MNARRRTFAGLLAAAALGAAVLAAAPAYADGPGDCPSDVACLFYNSGFQGSYFGDGAGNSQTPENYLYNSWYTFGGGNGSGAGQYVKNNAASVYDYNINYSVTIYYNSNNAGPSQTIGPDAGANLNSTLKNNNASQCFDFFQECR
ncbi:peptidase inhibitor family I36 protein [Kitasatospora viridis]|uniref:Peptidase inhibitor family I36 n=1 Tax=Kitasatospora viridis TaxID=281105 RepID=A0A561S9P8_9ACTN|nr:peptidase inhibitor family I36 protein [Kitasatospora viridis]TWF71596.1 peptidase inhibitor family I36 [Kitasatospora viridis]